MSVHTTALCSICLFGVCPCCLPVLTRTNFRACGCLLAPLSGITLTIRPIRSQHHILSNSYKLVRAPRPLCRCRPPHKNHMMQRLRVLCPAHRPRSVLPIHRFGWAPPALSQMTSCQLRSLRLPPQHLCKCSPAAPPATHPHPTSGCRHADYSTHRCLSGRLYATLARGVLSHVCPLRIIPRGALAPPSTHDVLCPTCSRPVPSLLLDAAVHLRTSLRNYSLDGVSHRVHLLQ